MTPHRHSFPLFLPPNNKPVWKKQIADMAKTGKESTFCMGDDIPLAVMSEQPHVLYDYFKQRFAQVRFGFTALNYSSYSSKIHLCFVCFFCCFVEEPAVTTGSHQSRTDEHNVRARSRNDFCVGDDNTRSSIHRARTPAGCSIDSAVCWSVHKMR